MNAAKSTTIAIHARAGSFSDRWINYCQTNGHKYRLVNCYDSDIVSQLAPCDALLWHWHQNDTKAILFARQFIASLDVTRTRVFPNIHTCWHFDDKVGQKYLLESIGAPLVPSYVFYELDDALSWIDSTEFPKVFKLRGGAGSTNVRLVENRLDAIRLCKKAFGKGFRPVASYFADYQTRLKNTHQNKNYVAKLKRMPSRIRDILLMNRRRGREKGYVYFQDYMPDNQFDTRVTVIGNRAFAFRRMVRSNDFRASGSGAISYDIAHIDMRCIEIAFNISERLRTQSLAFDFVQDTNSTPQLVETSYCYVASAVAACEGYWDRELQWHEESLWPEDAIIQDMLSAVT